MQQGKTKKVHGILLLRMALFALAAAALVSLVIWQAKIADKRAQLADLQAQIQVQNTRNDEIRKTVESLENEDGLRKYAEQKARDDLGYAKPGERIFVDVGGSD